MSARRFGIIAAVTRRAVLALLCCALRRPRPATATAADRAPGKAAIASAHPLASEAGYEVLRAGGNAFDAAVAVSAALMVVEPSGSGFLGGGMYLLHRASDGRNVVIDAREKAPLAATRDMFLDKDGNPVRGMSINTAHGRGHSGRAGRPGADAVALRQAVAGAGAEACDPPGQRGLRPVSAPAGRPARQEAAAGQVQGCRGHLAAQW